MPPLDCIAQALLLRHFVYLGCTGSEHFLDYLTHLLPFIEILLIKTMHYLPVQVPDEIGQRYFISGQLPERKQKRV